MLDQQRGLAVDGLQHVAAAFLGHWSMQQQLGEAEDTDHRGAQFVRGGGQEFALHAVDFGLARDIAKVQHGAVVVVGAVERVGQGATVRRHQIQQPTAGSRAVQPGCALGQRRTVAAATVAAGGQVLIQIGQRASHEPRQRQSQQVLDRGVAEGQPALGVEVGETVAAEREDLGHAGVGLQHGPFGRFLFRQQPACARVFVAGTAGAGQAPQHHGNGVQHRRRDGPAGTFDDEPSFIGHGQRMPVLPAIDLVLCSGCLKAHDLRQPGLARSVLIPELQTALRVGQAQRRPAVGAQPQQAVQTLHRLQQRHHEAPGHRGQFQ
jgi:hypothetical protein